MMTKAVATIIHDTSPLFGTGAEAAAGADAAEAASAAAGAEAGIAAGAEAIAAADAGADAASCAIDAPAKAQGGEAQGKRSH